VDTDSVRRKTLNLFLTPKMAASEPIFAATWTQRVYRLQKEAHVFYLVFKHPRTRWYARLVAACAAGYVFSPIQLIPNFIPVIGSLDDILVLYVGSTVLQKITQPHVLIECRELAEAAQVRRIERTTGVASVVVPVVIVTVWMLAAITVSALMATYIYR
jgi:uncharacterized membrane protein YkvA (DUF1232 family)